MMIKKITLFIVFFCSVSLVQAQLMDDLKQKQSDLKAQIGEKEGELNELKGELAGVEKEITFISGWQKGITGLVGFNFDKSNDWIASPNPNASAQSLNVNLTGFINKETEKLFWRNKAVITKAWSDVDLSEADDSLSNEGTREQGKKGTREDGFTI